MNNMTQQEIQERNKETALMLGLEYDEEAVVFNMQAYSWDNLKFHSDWNWLMEAVEFIENLKIDDFGYIVEMLPATSRVYLSRNNYTIVSVEPKSSRKKAIFIAVSDFAKLYNEGKL